MLAPLLMTSTLTLLSAADGHAELWAELADGQRRQAPTVQLAQASPPGPDAGHRPPPALPHGPDRGPGMPPGPPWLRGLALTEAQQDKVFAILHAQMPALRERMRELHKAREALQQAARTDRFDEARATALADAVSRATAAVELMRARSDAAIWQVLTPEQRRQVSEMPTRPHHGGPMPERAPR
jgi:Spy/CpxP family protein refolding chaperone